MNKKRELIFSDIFNIADELENYLRLDNSNGRWLELYVKDVWVVYYRKPHARNTQILYKGECLNTALSVLLDIVNVTDWIKKIPRQE